MLVSMEAVYWDKKAESPSLFLNYRSYMYFLTVLKTLPVT